MKKLTVFTSSRRLSKGAGAAVLFVGLFGLCPSAFATRTASFVVSGTNNIYDTLVQGPSNNECMLMVANASPVAESITVTLTATIAGVASGNTITITQNGAASLVADPMTDSARALGAAGSATDSVTYDWFPTAIAAGAANASEVKCTGTISVDDAASGAQGFITASGFLTTIAESSPGAGLGLGGGTSRSVTTSPTKSVIVVGEGRPF